MTGPARPLRVAALVAASACGLALVPAVASADTFAGGSLVPAAYDPDRSGARATAATTVETRGTVATLGVRVVTGRCYTGGLQRLRGTLSDPASWTTVTASRTITTRDDDAGRRGRVLVTVALRRVASDALVGTVTLAGRQPSAITHRPKTCRSTVPVALRSPTPAPRAGAPATATRYGTTDQRVSGGIHGAFVVRAASARRYVALWTARETCSSGGDRRPTRTILNTDPKFTIRADGRFRHVDRYSQRHGRFGYHFTGTIEGRIGADGIARGTVRTREVTTKRGGYYAVVCVSPRSRFVATP